MNQSTELELAAHTDLRTGQEEYIYSEEEEEECELYFIDNELTVDREEKKKRLEDQEAKGNYVTLQKASKALGAGVITTNSTDLNRLKKDELVMKLFGQIKKRKTAEQQVDML